VNFTLRLFISLRYVIELRKVSLSSHKPHGIIRDVLKYLVYSLRERNALRPPSPVIGDGLETTSILGLYVFMSKRHNY